MKKIIDRPYSFEAAKHLCRQGVHPTLARVFAARGIDDISALSTNLSDLLPPDTLLNADKAAVLLADAIHQKKTICIVGDYDCDGATASAVALGSLKMMGGNACILVPNRFHDGYGLTPEIVDRVKSLYDADLIVTVDNGIASIDGVSHAHRLGMEVLITDHHLPGEKTPENCIIVNPHQPKCGFESKNLAGVGVIFYVMLMLRAELRRRGVFNEKNQPRLHVMLDLVALGTLADLVPLDKNNRILVANGMKRIASGNMQTGIEALFRSAGKNWKNATTADLGFLIAPRLNAAGRLSDMAIGVECLTTDQPGRAWEIAQTLNAINQERREIETSMKEQADAILNTIDPGKKTAIMLLDKNWHQGVIGLLASRLKDRYFRPVFVFTSDKNGMLRGSGRSVLGFHLRDALDLLTKRHPDVISRFGGHAMAAGLTIKEDAYETFCKAFEAIAKEALTEIQLEEVIKTDGKPDPSCYTLDFVAQMESLIWGYGFEAPVFSETFFIVKQRILKNQHLLLQLEKDGRFFSAIYFNQASLLPEKAHLAFQISANEYKGVTSVQLIIQAAQAVN